MSTPNPSITNTSTTTNTNIQTKKEHQHSQGAIRHVEKRRISTCTFADRIASTSIQCYRKYILSQQEKEQKEQQQQKLLHQQQVCLATFVACWKNNDNDYIDETIQGDMKTIRECKLKVIGMGVGTKFLCNDLLLQEQIRDGEDNKVNEIVEDVLAKDNEMMLEHDEIDLCYGMRIRDLHAEILARRALRCYLLMEMHSLLQLYHQSKQNHNQNGYITITNNNYILEFDYLSQTFHLKPNVTIHMYTSSTPCGNSVIKKFAQMSKERFLSDLNPNQWPTSDDSGCSSSVGEIVEHERIPPHSIHLGQFSLLVKKDNTTSTAEMTSNNNTSQHIHPPLTKKQKSWPSITNDDWCPPGTSTVYHNKGTIHTCSDKICRWNCLGLQGSLLSSLLGSSKKEVGMEKIVHGLPIYMSSITVGRKFSNCICRRAVCCRAFGYEQLIEKNNNEDSNMRKRKMDNDKMTYEKNLVLCNYTLNHPSVMCTGVYLDESGVLDMTGSKVEGQDVRFLSSDCWIWWPSSVLNENAGAECIDGNTGLKTRYKVNLKTNTISTSAYSQASTYAFTQSYISLMNQLKKDDNATTHKKLSLKSLMKLKRDSSPEYEHAKDILLKEHVVFRHWRRRFYT